MWRVITVGSVISKSVLDRIYKIRQDVHVNLEKSCKSCLKNSAQSQCVQAITHQLLRILTLKHPRRTSLLPKLLKQVFRLISHTARARQTSDDLPLIMRNRELVQRSHRAGNEQHDVARFNQHNISSLQPKTRV